MKRNFIVSALILLTLLFASNVFAGQEGDKFDTQLRKLNALLKMNSFNLEDVKADKVNEWETSYVFSYSKGKLVVEYDESTHYYVNEKLTGSFVYKGKYEVDPKHIDSSSIECVNNSNYAMVNLRCQKKRCVANELTSVDYDKDKKVKYKREGYKNKISGFSINVKTVSTQDEVIELFKEVFSASN